MRLWFLLLFCGSLLLSSSCKDKQADQSVVETVEQDQTSKADLPMNKEAKNILCFGNSLTAGYGLDEAQAWPSLLQMQLDSIGKDYQVINAGLSGETTSGGLNRIDWILKQPVDIFILELGANDLLRGLDVNKTQENLEKIIEKVQTTYPDATIVLAGMLSPPNMGVDYERAFNNIFPALAMKYKAALIPFFLEDVAGIPELNLPDGKHPNAEGQKIVLNNVWAALSLLI